MDFLLYESNKEEIQNHQKNICNHDINNDKCTICGEYLLNLDKSYDEITSLNTQNTVINNLMENSLQGSFISSNYFNNLNKWTIWDQNYKEKCLFNTIYFIKDKCLGKIPNIVIDSAVIVLKKINLVKHESGPLKDKYIIKRGNNKLSLTAVCLYESSLHTTYPLTYEEVSKLFNLEINLLYKGDKIYKQLKKQIKLETDTKVIDITKNFLIRFYNQFEYEKHVFELATKVNENLNKIEQEIVTYIPGIRAICCLYISMLNLQIDKDKNIRKILQNQYSVFFNPSLLLKSFKNIKKMKKIIISDNLINIWNITCKQIRLEKENQCMNTL